MKYSKNIYFALTLMIILLGCKEEYEVKPATYSLMLTGEESKTWQQTSFTFIFNDEEVGEFDANQTYGNPS